MKLIFVLAVTALLAASTVHAMTLEEQILKKLAALQQETQGDDGDAAGGEDDDIIATPSNGTESSILEELNLNKRYVLL